MADPPPVERLPMFPLGRGIFPGETLVLRVFEPRYLEMIDHCLRRESGFGVVLIERGSEVGGGDTRFDTGVAVTITEIALLGNGHVAVSACGDRRIRIEEWLEDDPYPQALVLRMPDPAASMGDTGVRERLEQQYSRGLAMLSEMGVNTTELDPLPAESLPAAYRALSVFPVPDLDRQQILDMDDPAERIEGAVAALESVNELLEARLAGL